MHALRILAVYNLVKNHGLIDSARIAIEIAASKISAGRINRFFFSRSLSAGLPYFGYHLNARQGVQLRHAYMYQLGCREFYSKHGLKILEIGSYAGASAITWALSLRNSSASGTVFCVDPWTDQSMDQTAGSVENRIILNDMTRALKTGEIKSLFEHNVVSLGVSDLIQPIVGYFEQVSSKLNPGSFDLIYIDGNHCYSIVKRDLEIASDLLKVGGILCGDDLEELWGNVDQRHCLPLVEKDFIFDPKSKKLFHPGVAKAVDELFGKNLTCKNGFWALKKGEDGWSPVGEVENANLGKLPLHLKWWLLRPISLLPKNWARTIWKRIALRSMPISAVTRRAS